MTPWRNRISRLTSDQKIEGSSPSGVFFIVILSHSLRTRQARVAQSVEHQTFNLRAAGSSPVAGAKFLMLALSKEEELVLISCLLIKFRC